VSTSSSSLSFWFISCTSPHHSPYLHCHHLSLPRPFTPDSKSSVLQILSSIVLFLVLFGLLSRILDFDQIKWALLFVFSSSSLYFLFSGYACWIKLTTLSFQFTSNSSVILYCIVFLSSDIHCAAVWSARRQLDVPVCHNNTSTYFTCITDWLSVYTFMILVLKSVWWLWWLKYLLPGEPLDNTLVPSCVSIQIVLEVKVQAKREADWFNELHCTVVDVFFICSLMLYTCRIHVN